MPKQKISVALLLCDTPSPPVLAAHGTYLPIFTSLLQDSLKNAGRENDVELVIDGYQATDSELPSISRFEEGKEGSYDAILMTGSGRSRSSLVLSSPMLTLAFDLCPLSGYLLRRRQLPLGASDSPTSPGRGRQPLARSDHRRLVRAARHPHS